MSWVDPTPQRFHEEDITNGGTTPTDATSPTTPKDPTPPTPQPAPPEPASFHQDVQNTINKYPPEVMNLLSQHHVKFAGVRKVTDEAPELAGQHPRGWPKGATWDDCDGVYDVSRNTIVVAYEHLNDWTGKWSQNISVDGVLRHETGHAFNYADNYLSNTPAFQTAHAADQAAMPPDAQKRLQYFLQAGGAGRDEACADTFAHLQGGASFPGYDKDIATYFPQVIKVVGDAIANLPKAAPAQPGTPPAAQPQPAVVTPPAKTADPSD
jgi:hypothetical protein